MGFLNLIGYLNVGRYWVNKTDVILTGELEEWKEGTFVANTVRAGRCPWFICLFIFICSLFIFYVFPALCCVAIHTLLLCDRGSVQTIFRWSKHYEIQSQHVEDFLWSRIHFVSSSIHCCWCCVWKSRLCVPLPHSQNPCHLTLSRLGIFFNQSAQVALKNQQLIIKLILQRLVKLLRST